MFSLFCGFQLVIIFAVARGLSLSWRLQPWQNGEVRGPRQRTLERAMLVVAIEAAPRPCKESDVPYMPVRPGHSLGGCEGAMPSLTPEILVRLGAFL